MVKKCINFFIITILFIIIFYFINNNILSVTNDINTVADKYIENFISKKS